ncbi:MAG TPA: protease modulator HflC, partial [Paracoccus sp. (in: a-proteobacteria)]|nr:protease modulator HflC [Paracoccus sp. (in: a-proteobacteria)]
KKAEVVRGEADATRNAIYADAFGKDPEFFAFTRSMTAYERALKGENSSIVMNPDGEFFSYLKSETGGAPVAPVPSRPAEPAPAEPLAAPAPVTPPDTGAAAQPVLQPAETTAAN